MRPVLCSGSPQARTVPAPPLEPQLINRGGDGIFVLMESGITDDAFFAWPTRHACWQLIFCNLMNILAKFTYTEIEFVAAVFAFLYDLINISEAMRICFYDCTKYFNKISFYFADSSLIVCYRSSFLSLGNNFSCVFRSGLWETVSWQSFVHKSQFWQFYAIIENTQTDFSLSNYDTVPSLVSFEKLAWKKFQVKHN